MYVVDLVQVAAYCIAVLAHVLFTCGWRYVIAVLHQLQVLQTATECFVRDCNLRAKPVDFTTMFPCGSWSMRLEHINHGAYKKF